MSNEPTPMEYHTYAVIVRGNPEMFSIKDEGKPKLLGVFENAADAYCAMIEHNRAMVPNGKVAEVFKQVQLTIRINPN